ncbi:MAG: hypothetical protein MH825_12135 [Cyanobacteria bacterium]|nr:hypothetical protein [Cyanobacteriota bacterium]
MSQTDLLLLARQGNVEAITTLMNRKLATAGISVDAVLAEGGVLVLRLLGSRAPDREALMTFVRKGMAILKVRGLRGVQVSGWQVGVGQPAWTEWLTLAEGGAPPLPPLVTMQPLAYGPVVTAVSVPGVAPGVATENGGRSLAAPAVEGDPWGSGDQPEQQYERWIRETRQLGRSYGAGIAKLSAFLVYFLEPQESLLDLVGVRAGGRRSVLLLTSDRLVCLAVPLLGRRIQRIFAVPLGQLGTVGVGQGGLLVGTDAPLWLAYEQGDLGRAFLERSLMRRATTAPVEDPPIARSRLGTLLWVAGIVLGIYLAIALIQWLLRP